MYHILRKLLFQFNPETSHALALNALQFAYQTQLLKFFYPTMIKPKTMMGITFPNCVGLAAGLDKNGDYIEALSALGFGFIEIGTITPKAQIGNPKPRLFRLVSEEAIINRMGFNNKGVDYAVEKLQKINYRGVLGINIGKNKDTPIENAVDDYVTCFQKLYPFASYITINISSPNTANLRDLQQEELLSNLLSAMKKEQEIVFVNEKKYVPLVVKISPDLSREALQTLCQILLDKKIDGVIATNTTVARDQLRNVLHASESGGLSGKPLQAQSTEVIKIIHEVLQNQIPIIASGGVMDVASAKEKLAAGASLLQIYTGFIYHGPQLITELISTASSSY